MIMYRFCFCLLILFPSRAAAVGIDAGACTGILGVRADLTLPGSGRLCGGCFAVKPLVQQATNLLTYKLCYGSSYYQSSFHHVLPLFHVVEFHFFLQALKNKGKFHEEEVI